MADIKEILRKNVQKNASADQKPYGTLQQDLKSTKVNHECSKIAFDVMQQLLNGAAQETLNGLKIRLERAKQLETYIRGAKVGSEEESILLASLAKVRNALSQHLTEKRSFISKAANAITNSSVDVGGTMIAMSKNDPLMKMLVAGGGAASKMIKNATSQYKANRKAKQDALYNDAMKMYESVNSKPITPPKIEEPAVPESTDRIEEAANATPPQKKTKKKKKSGSTQTTGATAANTTSESSDGSQDKLQAQQETERSQKIYDLVQNIDQNILRLADTTDSLLEIARLAEIRAENLAFDSLENASESKLSGLSLAPANSDKPEDKDEKKGFLSNLLSGGIGNILGGVLGAGGAMLGAGGLGGILAKMVPLTKILGGIVAPLVDGILGYFKAGEWGVSGISAFLGGMLGGTFSNQALNIVANMGKWAVLGATLGSVVPGIGTVIGGVMGALIGGVLGYFGGEKIAKFLDNLGGIINQAFDAVINWGTELYQWVSTSVSDMWSFLTEAVNPYLEVFKSGLSWIGEQLSVFLDPIKETLTEVFQWMSEIGEKFWDWIKSIAPDWAVEGLAKAGQVAGAVGTAAYDLAAESVNVVGDAAGYVGDTASGAYNAVSNWWNGDKAPAGEVTTTSLQQAPAAPAAPAQSPTLQQAPANSAALQKAPGEAPAFTGAGAQELMVKGSDGRTQAIPMDKLATAQGQAFAGGQTHPGTFSLASATQKALGDDFIRFTAFNDAFHATRKSKHNQGLAFDVTTKGGKRTAKTAKAKIEEIMKAAGAKGTVLDEYNKPSGHATGGHLHVDFASQEDATKFAQFFSQQGGQNQAAGVGATGSLAPNQGVPNAGAAPAAPGPQPLPSNAAPVPSSGAQSTVNNKSAAQVTPVTIVNNNVANNNVSSVKGNQGAPQGGSHGTSGRRPSQIAATFGK